MNKQPFPCNNRDYLFLEIIILTSHVFFIAWAISLISVLCYNSSWDQGLCSMHKMKAHLVGVDVKCFASWQGIERGSLDGSQQWLILGTAIQSPTRQGLSSLPHVQGLFFQAWYLLWLTGLRWSLLMGPCTSQGCYTRRDTQLNNHKQQPG